MSRRWLQISPVIKSLPLARSWLLKKCALLGVELTQHTRHLAIIQHTAALPPATRITGAILFGALSCRICSDNLVGERRGHFRPFPFQISDFSYSDQLQSDFRGRRRRWR